MDYQELSNIVASTIAEQLKSKPNSVFGLPSGRSPLGCYKLLAEWSKAGKLDWSSATCFALDDYLDVVEKNSFSTYLDHNLYQYINLLPTNHFNPRQYDNYDQLIAQEGGLDLTILGLGRNGHIAFNEPGTAYLSWTHCVWLDDSTLSANAKDLEGGRTPQYAITMGIKTILQSRSIILIVSGIEKKPILEKALSQPQNADIPMSYLLEHKNLKILCDF